MVRMQEYEIAIITVQKHKGGDISCPRAVMVVVDLKYPETKVHMNGVHMKEFRWLEIVHRLSI